MGTTNPPIILPLIVSIYTGACLILVLLAWYLERRDDRDHYR